MAVKALEGVRVADFSWVVAGPICTKFLAMMGAEVIKIESREHLMEMGTRSVASRGAPEILNRPPNWWTLNPGKKSCTLNLSDAKGLELAKELVKISDVVIDNFSTGVMERWGLGYEQLKEIKPNIIVISSAGLGKSGPYREHVAYGMLVTSFAGLDSITGYEGEPPRGLAMPWADPLTGLYLTIAVLAALRHRKSTNEGQYIDLSMAEPVIAHIPEAILDYTVHGTTWGSRGNVEDGIAPHGCYPCKGEDKWIAISVSTEEEWTAFCRAIGNPSWCMEDRFADSHCRFQHRQQLDRLISQWTKEFTPLELMQVLQKEGIPSGPSQSIPELVEDKQLKERGFFVPAEHPDAGQLLVTPLPWKVHPNGVTYEGLRGHFLGEDNTYVFQNLLGLTKDEIETLAKEHVIY